MATKIPISQMAGKIVQSIAVLPPSVEVTTYGEGEDVTTQQNFASLSGNPDGLRKLVQELLNSLRDHAVLPAPYSHTDSTGTTFVIGLGDSPWH